MTAQTAAAKIIRDSGRPRFGGEKPVLDEPRRERSRFWLLAPVLLAVACLWSFRDSNRIEGFALLGGKPLDNARIVFRSMGGEYGCLTDSKGDFVVRLPKGKYSIYRLEGQKKVKSPSVLECESDRNFRLVFLR